LQATRQRLGEDLSEVAQMLRIRLPYLVAIEAGQYQALPGATYAVGFIRAYAEHLDLNSEEVVRRFKAESIDGGEGDRRLSFPTPVPETGIPGGAYVFMSLVIAVLGYGTWYLSTTKDGFFADLISPLDEQMTTLISDDKTTEAEKIKPEISVDTSQADGVNSSATSEPTVEVVSEPTAVAVSDANPLTETATTSDAPKPNETAPETVAQPQRLATSLNEPEPKSVVRAPEPVVAAVVKAVKPVIAEPKPEPVVESTVEKVVKPKIVKIEVVKKLEGVVAEPIEVAKVIPKVEAPVKPVVEVAPEPKPEPEPVKEIIEAATSAASDAEFEIVSPEPVTGSEVAAVSAPSETESRGPSRITINAKSNSWIQVRDDNSNTMLVTRLLTTGDQYVVPDQPGLVLLTGNAGALEVIVDGDPVPSIGGAGVVRRGVLLDVDRLKAGTAVSN
jgi:cytoskeleton protein RodZ